MADTDPKAKALARARKLYALAQDQAEAPEGKAAAVRLAATMKEWGITEDDLTGKNEVTRSGINRGGPELWRVMLLAITAQWFECESTHNLTNGTSRVYGLPDALEAVADGYEYLLDWLTTGCTGSAALAPAAYYTTAVEALVLKFRNIRRTQAAATPPAPGGTSGFTARGSPGSVSNPPPNTAIAATSTGYDRAQEAARSAAAGGIQKIEMPDAGYSPAGEMRAQIIPWPPVAKAYRKKPPGGGSGSAPGALGNPFIQAHFGRRG